MANPDRLWVPLVILLALFQMFMMLPKEKLHFYIMLVVFFLFLPIFLFSFKYLNQAKKRNGKSFLILKMPATVSGGAGGAMYLAIYSWVNLPFELEMISDTVLFVLAVLITAVWLYAYAATVYLPRRVEEMLLEQFPEYAH